VAAWYSILLLVANAHSNADPSWQDEKTPASDRELQKRSLFVVNRFPLAKSSKSTMVQSMQQKIVELRADAKSDELRTFCLERPGPFSFTPGQYVMVAPPGGRALPMAIANGTKDDRIELTIRRSRGTTDLFELDLGDLVELDGPLGEGFPIESLAADSELLMVAGGTGVTPVRSLLRSLSETQRPRVVVGAKSAEEMLYADEFERVAQSVLTIDAPSPEWHGATGLVTEHLGETSPKSMAFICGPDPMMKATVAALTDAGLDRRQIFVSVYRVDEHGKVLGPVMPASDSRVGF
jgi:NAD(P)H-flavin reductase